jgi:hypothetical protein
MHKRFSRNCYCASCPAATEKIEGYENAAELLCLDYRSSRQRAALCWPFYRGDSLGMSVATSFLDLGRSIFISA